MSKNTRRRNRLLARGATCHWCGAEVVYIHAREWPQGAMPPNFATVDHLDDRLSCPAREHRPPRKEERTVLACLACNLRRNREQQLLANTRNRSADSLSAADTCRLRLNASEPISKAKRRHVKSLLT